LQLYNIGIKMAHKTLTNLTNSLYDSYKSNSGLKRSGLFDNVIDVLHGQYKDSSGNRVWKWSDRLGQYRDILRELGQKELSSSEKQFLREAQAVLKNYDYLNSDKVADKENVDNKLESVGRRVRIYAGLPEQIIDIKDLRVNRIIEAYREAQREAQVLPNAVGTNYTGGLDAKAMAGQGAGSPDPQGGHAEGDKTQLGTNKGLDIQPPKDDQRLARANIEQIIKQGPKDIREFAEKVEDPNRLLMLVELYAQSINYQQTEQIISKLKNKFSKEAVFDMLDLIGKYVDTKKLATQPVTEEEEVDKVLTEFAKGKSEEAKSIYGLAIDLKTDSKAEGRIGFVNGKLEAIVNRLTGKPVPIELKHTLGEKFVISGREYLQEPTAGTEGGQSGIFNTKDVPAIEKKYGEDYPAYAFRLTSVAKSREELSTRLDEVKQIENAFGKKAAEKAVDILVKNPTITIEWLGNFFNYGKTLNDIISKEKLEDLQVQSSMLEAGDEIYREAYKGKVDKAINEITGKRANEEAAKKDRLMEEIINELEGRYEGISIHKDEIKKNLLDIIKTKTGPVEGLPKEKLVSEFEKEYLDVYLKKLEPNAPTQTDEREKPAPLAAPVQASEQPKKNGLVSKVLGYAAAGFIGAVLAVGGSYLLRGKDTERVVEFRDNPATAQLLKDKEEELKGEKQRYTDLSSQIKILTGKVTALQGTPKPGVDPAVAAQLTEKEAQLEAERKKAEAENKKDSESLKMAAQFPGATYNVDSNNYGYKGIEFGRDKDIKAEVARIDKELSDKEEVAADAKGAELAKKLGLTYNSDTNEFSHKGKKFSRGDLSEDKIKTEMAKIDKEQESTSKKPTLENFVDALFNGDVKKAEEVLTGLDPKYAQWADNFNQTESQLLKEQSGWATWNYFKDEITNATREKRHADLKSLITGLREATERGDVEDAELGERAKKPKEAIEKEGKEKCDNTMTLAYLHMFNTQRAGDKK